MISNTSCNVHLRHAQQLKKEVQAVAKQSCFPTVSAAVLLLCCCCATKAAAACSQHGEATKLSSSCIIIIIIIIGRSCTLHSQAFEGTNSEA
jgi:hypothetical protein